MHSAMFLGAMMALGAAAAPFEERAMKVVKVVDVQTVTVTAGQTPPTAAPVPAPAPATNPVGFLENHNDPAPAPPASSGNSSSGNSMLDSANRLRQLFGLADYVWDPQLASECGQLAQANGGEVEKHNLGSAHAQVLAPGQINVHPASEAPGYTGFDLALYSWHCEKSDAAPLQIPFHGKLGCDVVHTVLNMQFSDIDHYKIVTSPNYHSCGCAYAANPSVDQTTGEYQGQWCCNYR